MVESPPLPQAGWLFQGARNTSNSADAADAARLPPSGFFLEAPANSGQGSLPTWLLDDIHPDLGTAVSAPHGGGFDLVQPPPGTLARQKGDLLPLPPAPQIPPVMRKRKLCIHFEAGTCRRGSECNFAHGPTELVVGSLDADFAKRPQTTRMDFSQLEVGRVSKVVKVPEEQVGPLMTDSTRSLLLEVTGAADVRWEREVRRVCVTGTAVQVDKAERLLQRVTAHCQWGASEQKIRAVLRPRADYTSARLRLSGMVPSLKTFSITLSADKPQISIGADPSNTLRVGGPLVSRSHALLEFAPDRGAVYVVDLSTNGTFLNGRRLPAKAGGKVMVWHGDELLLQDPTTKGGPEFGYMVNLEMD